jgi:hypothetical protein
VVNLRGLCLGALLAPCSSCIPIPCHGVETSPDRHGTLAQADLDALQPGQATRDDVLCTLGEPDRVFEDGSRFVYHTRVVRWYLIFYIVVDEADVQLGDDVFTCFHFDEHGLLDARWVHSESYDGNGFHEISDEKAERWTRRPSSASRMGRP